MFPLKARITGERASERGVWRARNVWQWGEICSSDLEVDGNLENGEGK